MAEYDDKFYLHVGKMEYFNWTIWIWGIILEQTLYVTNFFIHRVQVATPDLKALLEVTVKR